MTKSNKPLNVGDKIPSFTLPDQHGNSFHVDDLLGSRNLVIFFYPKDESPGCTKQACSFRDHYEEFQSLDTEVVGISGQDEQSHASFSDKYQLNFRILSDTGNQVRKLFGVPADFLGAIPGRVTYVVDKAGIIRYVYRSQLNIQSHIKSALEVLRTKPTEEDQNLKG